MRQSNMSGSPIALSSSAGELDIRACRHAGQKKIRIFGKTRYHLSGLFDDDEDRRGNVYGFFAGFTRGYGEAGVGPV